MKKRFVKNLRILLLTALVGIGVAVTYFYFEGAVHHSISYIWEDVFNTDNRRFLLVPLCLGLALVYFGVQHVLDPKSEKHESHGLGDAPKPTIVNFIKVLAIGFLSLVAGASLGPEAVLVPACVLLGSYIGVKLFDDSKPAASLFGMAGFIALFTAFFNSFLVGVLTLLLIKKQFKTDITPKLVIVAVVAAASAALMLGFLDNSAYVALPHYSWALDIRSLLALAILGIAGYCMTYALGAAHAASEMVTKLAAGKQWWFHGLVAGAGLSLLYLLGDSLVEFTGNESVVPMFKQAADLGFLGLAWILFIKVVAIGWSKAAGYRGGLIFPTVFAASVLVAIAQLFTHDLNLIYGLIVVIVGALIADSKVKVLL